MLTIGLLMWIYICPQRYVVTILVAAALAWCALLMAGWSHGLAWYGINDCQFARGADPASRL